MNYHLGRPTPPELRLHFFRCKKCKKKLEAMEKGLFLEAQEKGLHSNGYCHI